MWVSQYNSKPSPSRHLFDSQYVYHSQSWVVYGVAIPTLVWVYIYIYMSPVPGFQTPQWYGGTYIYIYIYIYIHIHRCVCMYIYIYNGIWVSNWVDEISYTSNSHIIPKKHRRPRHCRVASFPEARAKRSISSATGSDAGRDGSFSWVEKLGHVVLTPLKNISPYLPQLIYDHIILPYLWYMTIQHLNMAFIIVP